MNKSKEHYANNKQYYKDKLKNWRKEHPEQYKEQLNKEAKRLKSIRENSNEIRLEHNKKCRERYHRQKNITPEVYTYRAAKTRAAKKGLPFTIEISDIDFSGKKCPIFDCELERSEGKLAWNSPSIDRINSKLGYVKDNIQIISTKANTMKSNATKEQLIKFARWVLANEHLL